MSRQPPSRLWSVTCFYNPCRYESRLANYHVFRRELATPLLTVEWAPDGRFQLGRGDAEVLLQVRGGDLLWQKERLLNLGIEALPDTCEIAAWVDCDVIFERDDWAELAGEALEQDGLVHLFTHRFELPRHQSDPAGIGKTELAGIRPKTSVVDHWFRNQITGREMADADAPLTSHSTCGLAWAARRDLLLAHGLYDACILGTGDRVMLAAAMGKFEAGGRSVKMSDEWAAHYRAWGRPFHAATGGRVGVLPGAIAHLWHGDLEDRRYGTRHDVLRDHHFDPARDIALGDTGSWTWSSDKPGLHRAVAGYFDSRREDG
ncbi:MAG: hypothetical protein HKO57_03195 [Akkermansiaceae bacterium]|nr:hypothetical protein [Akkermansiaceae bacterium]